MPALRSPCRATRRLFLPKTACTRMDRRRSSYLRRSGFRIRAARRPSGTLTKAYAAIETQAARQPCRTFRVLSSARTFTPLTSQTAADSLAVQGLLFAASVYAAWPGLVPITVKKPPSLPPPTTIPSCLSRRPARPPRECGLNRRSVGDTDSNMAALGML